jgi:acetyl esterase/lipase
MGKVWAGKLDAENEKISPLYGAFDFFPETLLFTGTREIFYPDVLKFHQKLVQAGRNVELVTGMGMNHVYPMYPIPEARKALETVIRFLTA